MTLTVDASDAEMSREAIGQELSMRLQRVDPDDPERLTEVLVQFARGLAFRVAVFEIRGEIPLTRIRSVDLDCRGSGFRSADYAYREVANSTAIRWSMLRVTIGSVYRFSDTAN